MNQIAITSKSELNHLYRGKDIQSIWDGAKALDVIKHPELGYISPNRFRQIYTDTVKRASVN